MGSSWRLGARLMSTEIGPGHAHGLAPNRTCASATVIFDGSVEPSFLAATSRIPSRMVSTTMVAALQLRSVAALAPVDDMLGTRVV